MHIATLTSILTALLTGCSTTVLRGDVSLATTEWKKGDFRLRFQVGPKGKEGRSYSFYEIGHTIAGQQEHSEVMESAHTTEGFECVKNSDPKDWIRIVEDLNGRALLIEEEIPNDCGPCSNYLWVHLDTGGDLESTYLHLPSKVTGLPEGIDYQYPRVISLNGNFLSYSYTEGATVTKRIDQIERSDRPTPPG
jgi:hypothetical protein